MTSLEATFLWLTALLLMRLFYHPFLTSLFKPKSKFITLPLIFLTAGYFYWLLGHLGLGSLMLRALISYLLCLAFFAGLWFFSRKSLELPNFDLEDVVFWSTLLIALVIRAHMGAWTGSEKFPDLAFFQAVFLDERYPPIDRWLPPHPVNYYYFSFVVYAPIVRILGIPAEFAVNLVVPTTLAMTASVAYGAIFHMTSSRMFALLSSGYMGFLSNWEWIKQVFGGSFWSSFSWWNSSRSIPFAITEFPYFSFLLGDFHPHYTSLPWFGVTLWMIFHVKSWPLLSVLALSLGAQYPMNAWACPVLALICIASFRKEPLKLLFVGLVSLLLFLPFWMSFERPISGIYWVPYKNRSLAQDFIYHWLPFLFPLLAVRAKYLTKFDIKWLPIMFPLFIFGTAVGTIAILVFIFRDMIFKKTLVGALMFLVFFLMMFCEFVSLDPTYGDPYVRMNTVFKFYMMIWWLLALCVPLILYQEKVKPGLILIVVFFSLIYPVKGTYMRVNEQHIYGISLNGISYWNRVFPGETAAVHWIREHTDSSDILLEAIGPPYQEYAKFSVFTGRPSLVGWVNHVQIWRKNGFDPAHRREQDLAEVFKAPSLENLRSFFQRYQVRWVVLGESEKKTYPWSFKEALKKLPLAFHRESVSIYRVPELMIQ